MVSLSEQRLRDTRARLAAAVLSAPWTAPLGSVVLTADQRWIASRAADALARDGGCLVAEEVGRGKTYIALALAARYAAESAQGQPRGTPLVVLPASLRDSWQRAAGRADVPCRVISHEALSRGAAPAHGPSAEPALVIVDESHRFRTPGTRRYAALARLVAHVPVVLLSATPLQNSERDLRAQLALFLGERADALSSPELAALMVRGGASDPAHDDSLPRVAPPVWVPVPCDDGAVLRALLALPEPPRAVDAGDAGALRTITLVRAWASSRAALAASLRRRARVLAAVEQSVEAGRVPSRAEIRSWTGADGDVQLGFASLLATTHLGTDACAGLRASVAMERAALAALQRRMRTGPDPDAARVAALRALRAAHAGARVIAFSELATTARAYYSALRGDGGVALLTANECRIASGPLARRELLARFAPRAQGAPEPPPRERIELLLATDLLSEGVNLQDASVVVHLDLPWNPMRLAQRVGRVRRPGGAALVHTHLVAPPAGARTLLHGEARLRDKLARVERTVGRSLGLVPALAGRDLAALDGRGTPRRFTEHPAMTALSAADHGQIARRLRGWCSPVTRSAGDARALTAGVDSHARGWLAALTDGRLLCALPDADSSGVALLRATMLAEGPARSLARGEREAALAAARAIVTAHRAARLCGVSRPPTPRRQAFERAVRAALARAPYHERTALAPLAARARALWATERPLGAEWELDALLDRVPRERSDVAQWLEALAQAARSSRAPPEGAAPAGEVEAIIVFGPAREGPARDEGADF